MIGAVISMHGHAFSAVLNESGPTWCGGPKVDIDRDGHHAGTGRWHEGKIVDCDDALVRDNPEATEEVFEALAMRLQENAEK